MGYFLYGLVAILWGVFAGEMQRKVYPHKAHYWPMVFIVNIIFCPVCIIIAIIKDHEVE